MSVDDLIQELEDHMATNLQYALFVNININFWEELDELDNQSIQVIRDIVRDVFEPLQTRYNGTRVVQILNECSTIIEHALIAAMNVPFPRDPILHVHHVVRNMNDIFIHHTYAQLRTEMIMIDHCASILQRVWRDAVTDPNHPICRRRLAREFAELVTA